MISSTAYCLLNNISMCHYLEKRLWNTTRIISSHRCSIIVILIMSDEHVWENKCISVWRGAGMCLCVGCIIWDNCKYLDVKLCIFIIWQPTYICINIVQLYHNLTCHNKLMRSDTTGKNWFTVIGNVGHNSTLACAEMILALFKATSSYAWPPHWFQAQRRRTARVYQPIILSK